jgi:ribose transport system permease protein
MKYFLQMRTIRKLASAGIVIMLIVLFALTADSFLTVRNIFHLLKDAAFLGIIASGASFVIVSGGIDLSVGGIACVVSILCSRFSFVGAPGIVVVLFGVLVGVACGCANGLLVTRIRLTPFVATLATGIIFSGLGLIFAFRNGGIISGTLMSKSITNRSYLLMGGYVGGFYVITIFWILMSIIFYILYMKTTFGLHVYAAGSNDNAALMSGINTDRVKRACFVISGAMAGLASALLTANMTAATATVGSGYEFQAIAACVVGGVALGGGKGDSVSALVGSLFLVLILNGLYKFGLPTYGFFIAQGAIIILVTALDVYLTKLAQSRTLSGNRAMML